MNDCLLESENFQITKSDNNKYLLLPVKKQQAEKFVLKECGKDIDSHTHTIPSFIHSHPHTSFLPFFEIKFARKLKNIFSHQFHTRNFTQCSINVHFLSVWRRDDDDGNVVWSASFYFLINHAILRLWNLDSSREIFKMKLFKTLWFEPWSRIWFELQYIDRRKPSQWEDFVVVAFCLNAN